MKRQGSGDRSPDVEKRALRKVLSLPRNPDRHASSGSPREGAPARAVRARVPAQPAVLPPPISTGGLGVLENKTSVSFLPDSSTWHGTWHVADTQGMLIKGLTEQ